MALISVVVPVYNGEKTIAETVESLLEQTHKNIEVIIINDGSTDSTVQTIEAFEDSRIKLFSYPNAGLSASRNRGMDRATGDYISFTDADDLWTPEKLADQLSALKHNPNAAVAYSWTDYIDAQSQFLQSGIHMSADGNVFAKLLKINFIESGSNVLIRRDALEMVGYFDVSLKAAEDWDMWLRLAKRYEFVTVPKAQVFYRRTDSMSSNVVRQERECLKVINRVFEDVPESFQPLRRDSLAQLYKYLVFKALEGQPGRDQAWQAAKCLLRAVQYNPALLRQNKVVLSVLLKIVKSFLK